VQQPTWPTVAVKLQSNGEVEPVVSKLNQNQIDVESQSNGSQIAAVTTPEEVKACLERNVFSGLCRDAGHKVCGDERPQDDRVLTGR